MRALPAPLRRLILLLTALAVVLGGALTIAPAASAEDTAVITGTVTGPGGAAIEDGHVTAYRWDDADSAWYFEGEAYLEDESSYSITGLRSGTYRVGFEAAGLVETYWNGAATLEDATSFTLADGGLRADVDATLNVGATVAGKVTVTGGGPEASIWVEVVRLNGDSVAGDYTNLSGDYSIPGIGAGTYTLSFDDAGSSPTVPFQYLGGTTVVSNATTFTVGAAGTTSTVDAELDLEPHGSGAITGTVIGAGGLPVEDVYVIAWTKDGSEWTEASGDETGAGGAYSIGSLLPGDYRVSFHADGYATQYYADATSAEDATPVSVVSDVTNDEIDVDLAAGASVAGKVTKTGGAAELGTRVTAYEVDGDVRRGVGTAFTAADGTYSLKGLPAGTFTLGFLGGTSDVPQQYLGGGDDLAEATTFTLGATEVRTGLDVTVVAGASVSGTVRTPAAAAASDAYVVIYKQVGTGPSATWEWFNDDDTASNGTYSFGGLAAGTYTLKFASDDYPTQYLGGVSTQATADTFTLAPGQTRSAFDYTLRTAETIDTDEPVVVPPVPTATTTSFGLSTASRPYGGASTATVQVAGIGTTVTGAVAVKEGTKTIASGQLVAGKATLSLPKTLTVGKHNLVAVYAGAGLHLGSTSATKALTVVKAKSTVSAKLAKKSIKKKSKGKVTVTVKATGLVPTGKVTVKDGKKVLKTVSLKNGKVTVTLPKLKKGKHKITVTYKGSATILGSTSSKSTLKVT